MPVPQFHFARRSSCTVVSRPAEAGTSPYVGRMLPHLPGKSKSWLDETVVLILADPVRRGSNLAGAHGLAAGHSQARSTRCLRRKVQCLGRRPSGKRCVLTLTVLVCKLPCATPSTTPLPSAVASAPLHYSPELQAIGTRERLLSPTLICSTALAKVKFKG